MAQRDSNIIITLWRGQESKICHSEKEIDAAKTEGFAEYNPNEHQYPRFIYRGEESVMVHSAGEEKEKTVEGFSRTATVNLGVIPDPVVAETAVPEAQDSLDHPVVAAILANHSAQIADLAARVAELEGDKKNKKAKASDN